MRRQAALRRVGLRVAVALNEEREITMRSRARDGGDEAQGRGGD
jgi:hypothetical protein